MPRRPETSASPRLAVLSPHCDDAVFACGDLLASNPRAAVITVFAGAPPPGRRLTPWDAAAGFRRGDDVMQARRAEDRAALALVGARPIWLRFHEAQYGGSPTVGQLAGALARVVTRLRPVTLLVPFGLFHTDHKLVHQATLRLARRRPWLRIAAYEDAIYRTFPGLVEERLAELARHGFHPRRLPLHGGPATSRKRWAVRCYGSQMRALTATGRPGILDAFAEEVFWKIAT